MPYNPLKAAGILMEPPGMVVSGKVFVVTLTLQRLTNIGTETCAATTQSDQCTLTTGRATRAQVAVLGVPCVSNNVVDRLATHQGVWNRGFAEESCAHLTEFFDQLTFKIALFTGSLLTLEVSDPAYIAHVSIDTDGCQLEHSKSPSQLTSLTLSHGIGLSD